MKFIALTILLARAGGEIGPHLLDGTDTPTLHRDIARHQVSIEELLKPFAGKKTGLAFRVHAVHHLAGRRRGARDRHKARRGQLRLDRLQRQGHGRRLRLGGRLYVVVHELGRGSAPRTQ